MSVVYVNGFDSGDHLLRIDYVEGSPTTTATGTRLGTGRCLVTTSYMQDALPASYAQVVVGWAGKVPVMDATMRGCIALQSSDGQRQATIGLTSTGIQVSRGFPVHGIYATSQTLLPGTTMAANTWYYVEAWLLPHDTTGRLVVKVDGVTHIDYTGDTFYGGAANIANYGINPTTSGTGEFYDDLYIADDSTFRSAPAQPIHVATLVPTGAGNSTQMAPSAGANWQCVDELPYSAADYVTGDAGEKDTYALANLPAGVETVVAVQTTAIAKKSDAGALSLRTVVRSAGTDYTGTTTALTTTDKVVQTLRTVDPATSTAWTVSGVNALEAGAEAL